MIKVYYYMLYSQTVTVSIEFVLLSNIWSIVQPLATKMKQYWFLHTSITCYWSAIIADQTAGKDMNYELSIITLIFEKLNYTKKDI